MATDLAHREYVPYESAITKPTDEENEHLEAIRGYFKIVQAGDNQKHGRAYPVTHAKTLGVIKGKVIVPNDLPAHLKQGPFAQPGEYGVVLRYSAGGHNVEVDTSKSAGRAVSFKIFGIPGDRFPEGEGNLCQDFSFNSQIPVSELSDARTAREMIGIFLKADVDPAGVQKAVAARPDAALQALGGRQKRRRLEAMEYYSQFAHRFGDYAAKHGLFPATDVQKKAAEHVFDQGQGSVQEIQTLLKEYHTENEAVFEWRFQLCENVEDQPTEYAGKEWSTDKYPYQTVAKMVFPKQDPINQELIDFWTDSIRMNPWRGTKALQPLGSSNRIRRQVYPWAQGNRTEFNKTKFIDVQKIEDLPGPLPDGAIPSKA